MKQCLDYCEWSLCSRVCESSSVCQGKVCEYCKRLLKRIHSVLLKECDDYCSFTNYLFYTLSTPYTRVIHCRKNCNASCRLYENGMPRPSLDQCTHPVLKQEKTFHSAKNNSAIQKLTQKGTILWICSSKHFFVSKGSNGSFDVKHRLGLLLA